MRYIEWYQLKYKRHLNMLPVQVVKGVGVIIML